MQHCSSFGDINRVAPKHAIDSLSQAAFLCQLNEEHEGVTGDSVLRVIEVDAHSLGCETLTALRVIRE
jgi:hypothetical protein